MELEKFPESVLGAKWVHLSPWNMFSAPCIIRITICQVMLQYSAAFTVALITNTFTSL